MDTILLVFSRHSNIFVWWFSKVLISKDAWYRSTIFTHNSKLYDDAARLGYDMEVLRFFVRIVARYRVLLYSYILSSIRYYSLLLKKIDLDLNIQSFVTFRKIELFDRNLIFLNASIFLYFTREQKTMFDFDDNYHISIFKTGINHGG